MFCHRQQFNWIKYITRWFRSFCFIAFTCTVFSPAPFSLYSIKWRRSSGVNREDSILGLFRGALCWVGSSIQIILPVCCNAKVQWEFELLRWVDYSVLSAEASWLRWMVNNVFYFWYSVSRYSLIHKGEKQWFDDLCHEMILFWFCILKENGSLSMERLIFRHKKGCLHWIRTYDVKR